MKPRFLMSNNARRVLSTCVAGVVLAAAAGAAPLVPAYAATATINGALSNFDTFNDTGQEAHGFEIELDDVHAADVQYFFGAPYNRYGTPSLTEFSDATHWGTKVRWESPVDASGTYLATTAVAPANPTPTDGHSCYLFGPAGATQQQYDSSGCEHFGIGTYGNPTTTVYHWLVDDGTNHGQLVYAGGSVSLPAPVWTASNGNVAAALPAPAPAPVPALPGVPDCALWGEAVWVKVYKTESHKPAQLGALLTDSAEVPESESEVEMEWEFLQGRPTCDDTGKPLPEQPANEIVHQAQAGAGAESVTRRYELFKYTGAYDDTDGGNHEALPLCDSNPYKTSCRGPLLAEPNSDLGAYMGAQMAAANLQAVGINTAVLTVAKAGDGAGVVTDGGGVNCGDLCGGSYSAGSAVTLTATPDADSRVAGWSVPACGTKLVCTVTMNASVTVTVTFSPIAQTPAPVVSGLSAATAPAGTTVTIVGSDLDTVSAVDFNGTSAEFSVLSSTSVSATVPCAAAAGPITVTADGGTASSARFTVANAKPTVTSFTPSSARPADTVAVTGTYLACLSSLAVGKVSAAIAASSHTRVSFLVPDAAVTAALTVRNAVGAVTTSAKLTVTAVPRISGFSPLHALPGATVTVSGTGLSGATSATVGGTTAKVKVVSPAQLTVTVPAGASTGELTVKVPTGTVTAPTDFTVDIPAPTVSSASVSSGPVGTSILVKGSNFTQSALASIAGASQRRVVVSPTAMVVTVSAGTSTGSLRVTTAGGAATLGLFTVTAGVAPTTITKVSAKSAVGGSVITITGTNVGSLAAVKVAGETAGFVVLTPTTAAVALPIGARTGTVSGVTATGAGISGPTVAVLAGAAAPTVTAVSPASAAVGTWVKVSGANLAAVTSVAWDNSVVDYYVTAANAIYIRVPRGAVSGPVNVATSGGSALSPSIKVT